MHGIEFLVMGVTALLTQPTGDPSAQRFLWGSPGCGPANPNDKGTKIVPPQPKPLAFVGRFVANQLGAGQVDGKKPSLLCIPSSVALP